MALTTKRSQTAKPTQTNTTQTNPNTYNKFSPFNQVANVIPLKAYDKDTLLKRIEEKEALGWVRHGEIQEALLDRPNRDPRRRLELNRRDNRDRRDKYTGFEYTIIMKRKGH